MNFPPLLKLFGDIGFKPAGFHSIGAKLQRIDANLQMSLCLDGRYLLQEELRLTGTIQRMCLKYSNVCSSYFVVVAAKRGAIQEGLLSKIEQEMWPWLYLLQL